METTLTPKELSEMSDVAFKQLASNHSCGRMDCPIGRESFNRPKKFIKTGDWNPYRQPTLEH